MVLRIEEPILLVPKISSMYELWCIWKCCTWCTSHFHELKRSQEERYNSMVKSTTVLNTRTNTHENLFKHYANFKLSQTLNESSHDERSNAIDIYYYLKLCIIDSSNFLLISTKLCYHQFTRSDHDLCRIDSIGSTSWCVHRLMWQDVDQSIDTIFCFISTTM